MNTSSKAVIVANDLSLGEGLRQLLADKSICETIIVDSHDNLLEALKSTICDIAIIELSSPSLTNKRFLREFKMIFPHIPVLVLSDSTSWKDEVLFLNSGADNVTAKPIQTLQLLARISAVSRWSRSSYSCQNTTVSKIGELAFKPEIKCLIHSDNQKIKLTEIETKILIFMVRHRGQTVLREDLLKYVWGYNKKTNTHTVETHVYRLRKKINPYLNNRPFIMTESRGYRLVSAL